MMPVMIFFFVSFSLYIMIFVLFFDIFSFTYLSITLVLMMPVPGIFSRLKKRINFVKMSKVIRKVSFSQELLTTLEAKTRVTKNKTRILKFIVDEFLDFNHNRRN